VLKITQKQKGILMTTAKLYRKLMDLEGWNRFTMAPHLGRHSHTIWRHLNGEGENNDISRSVLQLALRRGHLALIVEYLSQMTLTEEQAAVLNQIGADLKAQQPRPQ